MPQATQIVPRGLHPHTEVYINDNTVFTDTAAPAVNGVRMIFVIASPRGRDRVMLPFNTKQAAIAEFGLPNFKMFGQPYYNAIKALETGVVNASIMRITADNAAYSNVVVIAKVKNVEAVTGPPAVEAHLSVRFEAISYPDIIDAADFDTIFELATDVDPDVDGYVTYPVALITSTGRGGYGDSTRIRLIPSKLSDEENGFRNYRLETYELANSLNRVGKPKVGTLYPEAVDGNVSLFLEDVVNDPTTGSDVVNVAVNTDAIEEIYKMYKVAAPTTDVTLEQFDVLFGKNPDGTSIEGIVFDTAHDDYVALDSAEGIPLGGGSDGDFEWAVDPLALETRAEQMDAAYIKAFAGELDPTILSKRLIPADLILDAGYNDAVKTQLIAFLIRRYDAPGIIDGGIINTKADAIAWGTLMAGSGDFAFSKEFQHYKTRDPYTGKVIPVTITYHYASALPLHFKNIGTHIPFTGSTYSTLTGHVKGSLKPYIDEDDFDGKEALYNLRLNYYAAQSADVYTRGTQTTSQLVWSDLSEEHNVRILFEIKREVETMVTSLQYNFAEPEDRKVFTEDVARLTAKYAEQKVRSVEARFEMNEWEETRSILHCYVDVVYKTINKRGIVEIDINPRA